MKIPGSIVSVALSLLFSGSSFAAIDCMGEVTNVSLQRPAQGTVTLSLSGGPSFTYLCDVDGVGRNGVSATVCRTMYATLMAAKASGKKISIRFYDYSTCSAIPAWTDSGALGWTILLID